MSVNPPSAESPGLPCRASEVEEWLSAPDAAVLACVARHRGPFLVLGAAGKMGLQLCLMLQRALRAAGRTDPVIAVSRFGGLHAADEFTAHGLEVRPGDLTDPTFVAALPDAPIVFFLAGVKFGTAATPELLHKINAEMPRLVAERFRRARIVAFSTGCVYPFMPISGRGATEATPVAPVGEYAVSCVERERAFQEVSRRHGTAVALLRLNYSVELRYGLLLDIASRVKRGEPVELETGHVNVIWQRDALAYAIRALDLAATPARPLNVTGPGVWSVRWIAQRFAWHFGVAAEFRGREAPTAWLNDAGELHRLLGLPSAGIEEMISWVAAWILQGGKTWDKPTGFERRDGKF